MHDLRHISSRFLIQGDFVSAAPYGSGHINDTYAVVFNQSGTRVRYIFQRINHDVFPDPKRLMRNIERVCAHSQATLLAEETPEASRRSLSLIPTRSGKHWLLDGPDHWRCYPFIEKARTYDMIENTCQAEAAAKAFGLFQRTLADLPGERLFETIPDFHHTHRRFEKLIRVFEADPAGRAAGVAGEIDFVRRREADTSVIVDALEAGSASLRISWRETSISKPNTRATTLKDAGPSSNWSPRSKNT
jgi:hypothetical protein